MLLTQKMLKEKSAELSAEIAAARSARNLATRRRRDTEAEEREQDRHRRRRKRMNDRELEQLLQRRARVRILPEERPRIGVSTARKLYHRMTGILSGSVGTSDARGSDGLYSLHFAFTARGFASTAGRRWRAGEAERAARYIVREGGLEDGERGWWSNIADDRTELVAFFRALETVERHDRKNANVYCSEIIALPAELTAAGRRQAVEQVCAFFAARGLPYVAAVHLPDAAGDQRNFHCHIIYSLRPAERDAAYDWSFALAKVSDINTPKGILARRVQVVQDINATLHAAGIDKRYTPLSNKARGIAAAQEKLGQSSLWVSRRLAAAEARQALLDKVGSIAGRVRSSLVDANAILTRLRMEIGRIQAERDHRAAIGREVHAKTAGKNTHLDALRERVERILARQRSLIAARMAGTGATVQQCRTRLLADIHARKTVIQRMDALSVRIRRTRRRIELLNNLAVVEHGSRQHADHLNRAAILMYARLRHTLSEVSVAEPPRRRQVERVKSTTVDVLKRHRERLVVSTTKVLGHQALLAKRRLVEDAQIDLDRRAVTLIQRRRIALVRIKAMADAVQGVRPLSDRIAASHAIAAMQLRNIGDNVVDRGTVLNDAITAIRANGAGLLAELSKGPRSEKTTADPETPVPVSESTTTLPVDDSPSAAGKAADAGSPAPPNGICDDHALRRIVRRRKPTKNMVMFPPPPAERAAPDPELLHQRARQMEMLRVEVRRREKRIRAALRERTLRRLRRLDIEIIRISNGDYTVAADILTPEEIRVLMDPAFHKETQRFLGRIATSQHEVPIPPTASAAEQVPTADEEFEELLRQQQFLADRLGKHGRK